LQRVRGDPEARCRNEDGRHDVAAVVEHGGSQANLVQ
jgi:hypothetical protein